MQCHVARRMFPALKLKVTGLDPSVNYVVMVDIVSVDCYRYKFQDSKWVVAGKADQPVVGRQIHVHPDSPATGQQWMSRTLSFHKLKLTNNVVDKQGHVSKAVLSISLFVFILASLNTRYIRLLLTSLYHLLYDLYASKLTRPVPGGGENYFTLRCASEV